jgi:hypothetical protein
MTDPTPSAPTAEMLAQDFERAHKAAGYGSVRWNVERTRPLHLGDAERFVGWKRALAALARSEPPTAALDEERRKFQAETRRTSELTRLLQKWVARHEQEHGAGPWSRDCDLCALVGESKALMDRPINEPPTEGKIQAVATQRQPIVPYGRVTTHSVTGQQFFYRWPDFPYLDNASECVPVYLPTPVASEGDSLLPASQPTEPPTGEPVAIDAPIDLDLLTRAAQLLEWYADYIAREVGAVDIELHPYRPEVEETAEQLRDARALLAEARAPGAVPEPLVTMSISVSRDGTLQSDVQTHDNSYADVARGLAAVKREIERVFAERSKCPYFPANSDEANRPIVRNAQSPQAVASRIDAVDSVQEPKP